MASMETLGNLQRSSVRPLRSVAKAPTATPPQKFSIADLKNGASFSAGGSSAAETQSTSAAAPTEANASSAVPQPTMRFSVADLKNGASFSAGGVPTDGTNILQSTEAAIPSSAPEKQSVFPARPEVSLRERYRTSAPAPTARQAQNSQLPLDEQIAKLGKIRQSAVEYEAVFVDQLVKQMRPSPMAKTAGSDTFSDIAEQPFRDHLSQAGGLGLADSIMGQIARQEGLEQTLQDNPEIMGPNWRPSISPNLMRHGAQGSLTSLAETETPEPLIDLRAKARPLFLDPEEESFIPQGVEETPTEHAPLGQRTVYGVSDPPVPLAKKMETNFDGGFGNRQTIDVEGQMRAETNNVASSAGKVGLMNEAEIAYLYNDASEAWT